MNLLILSNKSFVCSVFSSSGNTYFIAWSNSVNEISPLIDWLTAMNYSFASVTNSWSARERSSHKMSMHRCWNSFSSFTLRRQRMIRSLSGGNLLCILIHGCWSACKAVMRRFTTGSSMLFMKSRHYEETEFLSSSSKSKSHVLIFLKSFSSESAKKGG